MDFKDHISDFQNREILAWMTCDYYQEEGKFCQVYPCFFLDTGDEIAGAKEFPDNGAISINLADISAATLFHYSCEPVIIKIGPNMNPRENTYYDGTHNCMKYFCQYYHYKSNNESYFTIKEFQGVGFYQVIDNDGSFLAKGKLQNVQAHSLFAKQILLQIDDGNNRKLIGPFEWIEENGQIKLTGIKEFQYIAGEYDSSKFEDDFYVVTDEKQQREARFIKKDELQMSPTQCEVHYDFIDNDTLLSKFKATLSSEKKYSRSELRRIVDDMSSYISDNENSIDSATLADRNKKIRKWVLSMAKEDDRDRANLNDLLLRVFQYANEDDQLCDVLHEQIKHLPKLQATDEVGPIDRDIQQYEEKIRELQNQLEASKAKCSELTATINQNSPKAELEKEISELSKQKENLENQNKVLEAQNDTLQSDIVTWSKAKDGIEEQINKFKNSTYQATEFINRELINKLLRSIGEEPLNNATQNLCLPVIQYLETSETKKKKQDEIIATVQDYLQNAHREAEWNDVANYLICITQGFITTFAGEPGTGKTSLCTLLAKALGLAGTESSSSRFVDISVERGWTSVKDFIGYYNPLSKRTIASNERVLYAFEQMNYECRKKPNVIAPYLLLLDEANLSPIEHYWAPFFKSCDFDSAANRSISLGGKTIYQLPEHLRFLATVNFDHSTEELSPRFLDRSWVITLNPDDIDASNSGIPLNTEHAISFSDLKSAFTSANENQENAQIWAKWEDVKRIFKGFNSPIMPRSQRMVTQYLHIAEQCMDTTTARTSLAPIDYAIAQKILPTINGYGESYKNLIEELRDQVAINENSMPLTYNHLERMKKAANENMDFYQFFAK